MGSTMKHAPIAAAIAVYLFAAFAMQSATAAPASVTGTVNLRNGPGTTFTTAGKIPAGATVDVGECKGQWCQVTWQGQSGYVIATSLVQGGALPPGTVAPHRAAGGPPPGALPPDEPPPDAVAGGPPPDYYGPPAYPPPYPYPYPYYYGGYYGPYYGGPYYGYRYGGGWHRHW
jgi:uncharacterized protein YraI